MRSMFNIPEATMEKADTGDSYLDPRSIDAKMDAIDLVLVWMNEG